MKRMYECPESRIVFAATGDIMIISSPFGKNEGEIDPDGNNNGNNGILG